MQDALGSLAGGGALNDKGIFPGLSMKQRVLYFMYSFCGATACLFLAMLFLLDPSMFAFLISLSNLGYVIATGLIVGPGRQMKAMRQPKRIGCVAVFIVSWISTVYYVLVAASASFVIVLILAGIQVCAYLYYLLSYIPYGRKGAQKLVAAAMK
jgi:hypothetical protein